MVLPRLQENIGQKVIRGGCRLIRAGVLLAQQSKILKVGKSNHHEKGFASQSRCAFVDNALEILSSYAV